MKTDTITTTVADSVAATSTRPAMVNEITSAPALFRKSETAARPHILDRRAARWARRAAY